MCKYCKRLEELRKEDRIIYDRVLEHYKKELRKDDDLFNDIRRHLEVNAFYTEYLVGLIKKQIGGDDNA